MNIEDIAAQFATAQQLEADRELRQWESQAYIDLDDEFRPRFAEGETDELKAEYMARQSAIKAEMQRRYKEISAIE